MQRGIPACQQILESLSDGVSLENGKLHIVDLLMNRLGRDEVDVGLKINYCSVFALEHFLQVQ